MPLEREILRCAESLQKRGVDQFYGYAIAKEMRTQKGAKALIGYGTLYKALQRLEAAKLLDSYWEDAREAAAEGRLRRRMYRLTRAGQQDAAVAALETYSVRQLGATPK